MSEAQGGPEARAEAFFESVAEDDPGSLDDAFESSGRQAREAMNKKWGTCECDRPDRADDPHRHMWDEGCDAWGRRIHESISVTLVEFLLARIAEDEDVARFACAGVGARWHMVDSTYATVEDETGSEVVAWGGARNQSDVEHIVRHDPARVIAECQAKRRIVAAEMDALGYPAEFVSDQVALNVRSRANGRALRALAAVYNNHSDYDADWRP